jgi:hypothetical protein
MMASWRFVEILSAVLLPHGKALWTHGLASTKPGATSSMCLKKKLQKLDSENWQS